MKAYFEYQDERNLLEDFIKSYIMIKNTILNLSQVTENDVIDCSLCIDELEKMREYFSDRIEQIDLASMDMGG